MGLPHALRHGTLLYGSKNSSKRARPIFATPSDTVPTMSRLAFLLPLLLVACASVAQDPAPRTGFVLAPDEVPIAYEARGVGTPTLVFVHGWSCNRGFWAAQLDEFASDHRIVAVDLGGHGDSGDERDTWTLPILAQDLVAVVEELDLHSVILIGHSMGGPVSLLAAPYLGDRVLGVIGADTLQDAEFEWNEEMFAATIARFEEDFVANSGAWVRSMFDPDADPALVEEVVASMTSMPPRVAIDLIRAYAAYDAPAAFAASPVPIRCINVVGDFETKAEINRKYADFDWIPMEGVGHFLMMEAPDDFNAHLRRLIEELAAEES